MLWLSIALGAEVDAQGDARLLGSLYPDFEVDADGGTTGQKAVLETRLRVGVDLAFSDGDAFHLEGDVLDAQVLGNPWQLGAADTRRRDVKGLADASAYVIRRASFTSRTGPVLWEAGLQTSQWGLGLVANNGTADPLFGRVDGGDTVLRLKGSTMPLGAETPLYLVLSADRVYADDAARWLDGQAAYQGVLALLWRGDVELGAYGVLRHQREEDRSLRTTAGVVDVYGRVPVITGETSVSLGWEAAGIVGQTSRAASYNSTSGLKLRSGGGLGVLAVERGPAGLLLRGGYATGDGDPYDDTSHDFTADPNLDVGMVLFDEVLGAVDARAYQMLEDPHNIGQPPGGADALVAEGAWRRSTFAQPVLRVDLNEQTQARAGVLVAWSTSPVSQAFYSGRAGGVPTSHLNKPWSGSYHLGTEFDWALETRWPAEGQGAEEEAMARFSLAAQGGYLLPGDGLGMEDGVVMLHTLTVRALF